MSIHVSFIFFSILMFSSIFLIMYFYCLQTSIRVQESFHADLWKTADNRVYLALKTSYRESELEYDRVIRKMNALEREAIKILMGNLNSFLIKLK